MIIELIYKYLNQEATEKEVAIIFKWIESSQDNKNTFMALKKEWVLNTQDHHSPELAWKNFKQAHLAKTKRRPIRIWKYAAVLIIALGLVKTISVLTKSKITPTKEVVLERNDGKINFINEREEKQYLDSKGHVIAEQKNDEIIYHPATSLVKKAVYNTITIPNGKTFKVILSDGSIVHLNSGTTFKYPEQFISANAGDKRAVFLTGEAFFEVAKDKTHPFVVHSNNVNVEVLGTKFNLSSYKDDLTTHCELVEGSVRMSESANQQNASLLTPNHKATWDNKTKTFKTDQVDVKFYTSWVYGELMFQNEPFNDLIKKLERAYGVNITNNNTLLATQQFTGTIKIKESSIESILDLLRLDTPFEYEIDQNNIEITNQNQ